MVHYPRRFDPCYRQWSLFPPPPKTALNPTHTPTYTYTYSNDLGRACLLSPITTKGPNPTRDCTCYPLTTANAGAAAAADTPFSLPLPDPISNASFRHFFELLGAEDNEGAEVDRWGLSLVTAKKTKGVGAVGAGVGGVEGSDMTDSLDVTGELIERRCGA